MIPLPLKSANNFFVVFASAKRFAANTKKELMADLTAVYVVVILLISNDFTDPINEAFQLKVEMV